MKHIKKKFRYEDCDFFEELKTSKKTSSINIDTRFDRRVLKDSYVLLKHNSGKEVLSFPMKFKNETFLVPIPDYVLMFYNHAYLLKPELVTTRDNLLKSLRVKSSDRNLCENEIYNYFGYLSSFIFNLYCSLESYVNRCISDRCFKIIKKENYIELIEPQRNSSLFDKIKIVFPKLYESKKNFWAENIQDYQCIDDLHKIRDDLAHTKSDNGFNKTSEIDLFQRLVNFNIEGSLIAVRRFVNHYTPGYMEDCDCGKDF
jgi:hypothetical protein